jgi:hypothetical protein
MSFQSDMAETAHELLTEFGATATLKKVSAGTYDPSTGTATRTESTSTITLYEEDVKGRDIDGTLIKSGDKMATISAQGLVPETGDVINYMGVDWSVVSVTRENTNALAVVYYAVMRK